MYKRQVVENGWLPVDLQVGQNGKTVRPQIYFAIGISGAIQHVPGMEAVSYTHLSTLSSTQRHREMVLRPETDS